MDNNVLHVIIDNILEGIRHNQATVKNNINKHQFLL
jgi:hypothetical protein